MKENIFENEDFIVFMDTDDIKSKQQKMLKLILDYCIKTEAFDSEVISQSDTCTIESIDTICEMVDYLNLEIKNKYA